MQDVGGQGSNAAKDSFTPRVVISQHGNARLRHVFVDFNQPLERSQETVQRWVHPQHRLPGVAVHVETLHEPVDANGRVVFAHGHQVFLTVLPPQRTPSRRLSLVDVGDVDAVDVGNRLQALDLDGVEPFPGAWVAVIAGLIYVRQQQFGRETVHAAIGRHGEKHWAF